MTVACIVLLLAGVAPSGAIAEDVRDEFVPPDGLPEGWYARIDTSMGRIVARLLPEQAPQTVAHFAALAEGKLERFDRASGEVQKGPFYDGIEIGRVQAGALFELGDPSGTGMVATELYVPPREGLGPVDFGGPGRLGLWRDAGVTSARRLFATASAQPWLSRMHPCFGVVVLGRQVIEGLSAVKADAAGRPIDPPVLQRIRIFAVGQPRPLPEPRPYTPQRQQVLFNSGVEGEP